MPNPSHELVPHMKHMTNFDSKLAPEAATGECWKWLSTHGGGGGVRSVGFMLPLGLGPGSCVP